MKKCLICGKDVKKGDMVIDVGKISKRLPFDWFVLFAWDMRYVHFDCLVRRENS